MPLFFVFQVNVSQIKSIVMSEDINEQLYWAAQDGRYAEVAACIARGAEPGWTHRLGWAALHWAAAGGHTRKKCIGKVQLNRLLTNSRLG